jgi:hypothetical protein
MPKGVPSAKELMSREVKGFALDTSVVRKHGYRFDVGDLDVLPRQLPPWMKLYMSDVVRHEIVSHLQANTKEAFDQLKNAVKNIDRLTEVDISGLEKAATAAEPRESGKAAHEDNLKKYVRRFSGEFVPIAGKGLLEEVFNRYFTLKPPFEAVADKKHEFPDAAALITVERLAEKLGAKFVLVSTDKGWQSYADASDRLYCVETLEQLTALYTNTSKAAEKIKNNIAKALQDPKSKFAKRLRSGIEDQIYNLSWVVEGESEAGFSFDAEVDQIEIQDVRPNVEEQRLWLKDEGDQICVVEVQCELTCEFHISADFSKYDSIDKDEMPMGTGSKSVTDDVTVSVFLTIHGDLLENKPNEWEVNVSLSNDIFWIEAGDLDPDWYNQGPGAED